MYRTNQQPRLFSRPSIRFRRPHETIAAHVQACEVSFSTFAGSMSEQLKAPEDSSLRTSSPGVWVAADSGSRSRSSSERAWADAKTAIGGGGSFGNDAYQLSFSLLREGASAGFAQAGTHTNFKRESQARHKNHRVRSKKLIFRELDRPFETAPKITRESTSTKNRACAASRVTRLRRLIRLSSSRKLMKSRYDNIVAQSTSKQVEQRLHGHRACCWGGSSLFQSSRTCSPFFSAKSYKASQRHSEMHP